MPSLALPACAKVNLDLRVLGMRPDGYHDLRTVFQSLALHDTVTLETRPGPLTLTCTDADVPTDHRNLAWKAASLLWRVAMGKRGEPRDLRIHLAKRVPSQAGLGGGSADAAVTLMGLSRLWALDLNVAALSRLGARLGADVPFFLVGGTALGLGRGDDIYPLVDLPRSWVVVVRPRFGVSTVEAYGWFDEDTRPLRPPAGHRAPAHWPAWAHGLRNDLEPPVARRHPTIDRIRRALQTRGAAVAAMSGSGSAVFGVFTAVAPARQAALELSGQGWATLCTRTLSRSEYARQLRLVLAGRRTRRID
jgi:4-diphosphocytidyl-2-C-methyl-D-erythritol kinase